MNLRRRVLIVCLLLVSPGLTAQGWPTALPTQLGLAPDRLDQIVSLMEEAVERQEL